jgi:hypothetical protein
MIDQGGDEDAGSDRQRLAIARGEDEGEQLGLVADLGERHHTSRNEQGFHETIWRDRAHGLRLSRAPDPAGERKQVKGLAKFVLSTGPNAPWP